MLQSIVVLLVVVGLLVYMVRHYARIFRSDAPNCSGCAGKCAEKPEVTCPDAPKG
jgi:hypothetical protein